MDNWHATFLGLRHLPREVTAFEIEAFYQFSAEECRVIEERRRPELKLALALQIGGLSRNRRKFRHPSSNSATSASKSIILPSL